MCSGLARVVGTIRFQPDKAWAQGDEGRLLRAADYVLRGARREFNVLRWTFLGQHVVAPLRLLQSGCSAAPVSYLIQAQQMHCCQRTGNLGAAVEEVAAIEDSRAASVTRQCAASLI